MRDVALFIVAFLVAIFAMLLCAHAGGK